jgi:hypothetical protein
LIWTETGKPNDYNTPFNGELNYLRTYLDNPVVSVEGNINSSLMISTHSKRSVVATGKHCIKEKCIVSSVRKSVLFRNKQLYETKKNLQIVDQNTEINEVYAKFGSFGLNNDKGNVELIHKNYPLKADIKVTDFFNGSYIFDTDLVHALEVSKYSMFKSKFQPIENMNFNGLKAESVLNVKQGSIGFFSDFVRGFGSSNQSFSYNGPDLCYSRYVRSVENVIILDQEKIC